MAVLVFWPNTPAPTIYDGMKVYAFNAGKADSFLIYNADFSVLIDTGEKELGDTIIEYLNANDIKKLDYLIVTHFDKDHIGSADEILESVDVRIALPFGVGSGINIEHFLPIICSRLI